LVNNNIVAAVNDHTGNLFIKEGWNFREVVKEFKELEKFNTNFFIIGHFGLSAWNFDKDNELPLTDF
jgi:hypothetical protein